MQKLAKNPEWKDILFYPKAYEYVPRIAVNGLGSKGYGRWVKDTIGGICLTEAGHIHDAYYYLGRTSRKYADQTFLRNMNVIIDKKAKSTFHRRYCKTIAYTYYLAVRMFGESCFHKS
jgi:hypothetical protein